MYCVYVGGKTIFSDMRYGNDCYALKPSLMRLGLV